MLFYNNNNSVGQIFSLLFMKGKKKVISILTGILKTVCNASMKYFFWSHIIDITSQRSLGILITAPSSHSLNNTKPQPNIMESNSRNSILSRFQLMVSTLLLSLMASVTVVLTNLRPGQVPYVHICSPVNKELMTMCTDKQHVIKNVTYIAYYF